MNKAILTPFTILCLLSILFLMECKTSVKAGTEVIYVPTEEHPTIQEAINHAISGDTIFVHKRTYYEHVVVNKSVSLVGEDRDLTIVDGNGTGNVISIKADNVSIEGFTIRRGGMDPYDYGSGIFVDANTRGIDISHNTITNNYYGIILGSSSNNMISGNTISSNNDGISLWVSSNNMISGNTISSNDYYGISLYFSSSNVFSGNTISSNNNYGMYFVLYSKNNIIYCNNFNNTYQVWSDSTNVWDDGDEGNYWSDYNGIDFFSGPYRNETGSDGIGDTPYYIDENNQDNYPLMGMFSDFKVALERETYHVTTVCNSTISEFRFEIGPETGNKIIRFNVTGKDSTVGFCRVRIPTELMKYPYIVLVGVEEIVPTLLDVSNETYVYLYFTYIHSSRTITIVSSKMLTLYNELLDEHIKLQTDLYNLNATYYDYLNNYSILLGNYSQLQKSYNELKNSYQEHLSNYSILLGNYSELQKSYRELSNSYQDHLSDYSVFLGNYSELQKSYRELSNSYQDHLLDYSKNVNNIRNLMYIFAAATAIFIITTIYLSKRAHYRASSM